LGSMHVELNPPLGQPPRGRLQPGATIPLDRSSSYPSTEQTLSALSAVLNSGGLGQIGDIVHNFSAALSGHETDVRQLLTRLDEFVGVLDQQRDRIIASIESLNRLAGTFASQREVITQALRKIPPALDVLIRERPRITAALDKLRVFSNTATQLVNETQADLVKNLRNLEPTIQALADVGPDLSTVLGYVPTFPFTQNFIDRAVRGDYFNVFAVIDMTIPRLKRTLLAGTRWGDPDAPLVPAPGDPWFSNYTYDPLGFGVTNPPPPSTPPSPGAPPPAPAVVAPDMSAIAPVDQPSRGGG
ncbi:MCE family protein, partial [Mycobacterium colombiense]